jgi:hypothetical protein
LTDRVECRLIHRRRGTRLNDPSACDFTVDVDGRRQR